MNTKTLFFSGLLILVFVFYWYELRPAPIRQRCETVARIAVRDNTAPSYEEAYLGCVRSSGLSK